MLNLFSYDFFINALIAILLISVASAMIGTYIVTRRLVSISGGITHACFGGLGLGYFLGINPTLMAALFATASALGVEWMSARKVREDSAIAVVWSLGMAIGVIFVFLTPGYVPELNSFLFGNLLTVSRADLWVFAIFTFALLGFFLLLRNVIIACAFDRDFAAVTGLPVKFVTIAMTVFVALAIVLTIRLVGIMLLISMFTMPQMISELFSHRFGSIMLLSVVISCLCSIAGLMLGALIDVPCSAIIVLVMAVTYLVCKVIIGLKTR
ncbi:MAG: metal ABC transporter permease [Paramuribaculum sp.]|nr:metal ABC transporter permease [Paramuribaculum sp.]MDE6304622.1 metal ABC transporter permease [Paramuribaculum sp.]